jgi:hypothetical protein
MSLADLVMEPVGALLDEADVSKYLLPATLLGLVRYKRPGVSAAAREAAERYHRAPVTDPIRARDTVFHATDPNAAESILRQGEIVPWPSRMPPPESSGQYRWEDFLRDEAAGKADEFSAHPGYQAMIADRGVSVSRVPRAASKETRAVSLVIDRSKMPPSRPFAERAYRKTLGNAPWQVDEYHKPRMNPVFEFEDRTLNKAIPKEAIREIWVDKSALPTPLASDTAAFIESFLGPSPRPRTSMQTLRDLASQYGLLLREFETGREMHSGRIRPKKK